MVVPGQPPPVNIGYANRGVDDPHLPTCITEIYLVGRGSAQVRIEQQDVTLDAGDLLVIEPGEDARTEKVLVSRERLGLS